MKSPRVSGPWISRVDLDSNNAVYGYDLCGPISYRVLLVDPLDSSNLLETDLVEIIGGPTAADLGLLFPT